MKLKTENIVKLADHMSQLPPEEYDQSVFEIMNSRSDNDCATPGCLFGHMAFIFPKEFAEAQNLALDQRAAYHPDLETYPIPEMGKVILGIDTPDSYKLADSIPEGFFFGREPYPIDAVVTLRHLALTGEVDWTVAPNARRTS